MLDVADLVAGLVPGIDPHRRAGNPLRTSEDDGGLTGLAYAALALVGLTGVPAAVVAANFGWAGVAVGVLTGALAYWGFGSLAERRLRSHGPELLNAMRTGRGAGTAKVARKLQLNFDQLSVTRKAIAWWCLGLGAIPLVPQGIIAAVFVGNDMLRHTWFVATYMPPALRYPVAAGFIALGLAMYGIGVWIIKPRGPAAQASSLRS